MKMDDTLLRNRLERHSNRRGGHSQKEEENSAASDHMVRQTEPFHAHITSHQTITKKKTRKPLQLFHFVDYGSREEKAPKPNASIESSKNTPIRPLRSPISQEALYRYHSLRQCESSSLLHLPSPHKQKTKKSSSPLISVYVVGCGIMQ